MTTPVTTFVQEQSRSSHPSGVECLDVAQWFDFLLGSAITHIWEAGQGKNSVLEDLRKARYFLDRKIAQLEKG